MVEAICIIVGFAMLMEIFKVDFDNFKNFLIRFMDNHKFLKEEEKKAGRRLTDKEMKILLGRRRQTH